MGSDLLRRVRWRNVGRAGGAVLVVAAVVAWPRLNAPAPRLPDPAARPLFEPTPEGVEQPPAEPRDGNAVRPRDKPRSGGSAKVDRPRVQDAPGRRRQTPARRRHESVPRPTGTPRPPVPDAPSGAPDEDAGAEAPHEGTWVAPDEPAAAPPDDDPAQREFGIEREVRGRGRAGLGADRAPATPTSPREPWRGCRRSARRSSRRDRAR